MRIVLAQKYLMRGSGPVTYVLPLMRTLESIGHELVPFSVAYAGTEDWPYSEYFVSPPAGADAPRLRDMRLGPATMLRLLGRATYSVEAYQKAARLAKAAQPDIVYAANIYHYMSPSIFSAFKRQGLPIVMWVADYYLLCPELHLLRDGKPCDECVQAGFKRALRYRCLKGSLSATAARVFSMYVHQWLRIYDLVDVFVTPARFTADTLARAGISEDRLVDIPNFVDPSFLAQAEQDGSDEQDYILYSGRVTREKGIATLIEALSHLRGRPRLVVAGSDRDGEVDRLRALADRLGVRGVEFVGYQEPDELKRLLRACLFTVVPSVCYDNAPFSVVESLAYRKPVVGSRIGGIPEQITPECGLLFEPGDSRDLAEKMQIILDGPTRRRQMGEAGRKRVREHFTAEKHCEKLLQVFGRLLGKPAEAHVRPATA